MSTATYRPTSIRASHAPGKKKSRWRQALGWLSVAAVAAFFLAWGLGFIRFTTDPRVTEIIAMQEAAQRQFAANGGPSTLAEAKEMVASMNTIREKVESLPPTIRWQAARQMGNSFANSMRQRMNEYFDAPPDQRRAVLDRQIKQGELMRQAFEAARPADNAGGGPNGGPGQTAGAGPGNRPWASSNEDERNNFRKRILDGTTPQQRARFVEYRRVSSERREQLGIPSRWP